MWVVTLLRNGELQNGAARIGLFFARVSRSSGCSSNSQNIVVVSGFLTSLAATLAHAVNCCRPVIIFHRKMRLEDGFAPSALSIRKEIRPDIGSIYHLTVNGKLKRIVLLADGFVVNFFARHEKGVKTEYIDPVVTMQLLGAVLLSTTRVDPGVHKIDSHLHPKDIALLWSAINENCRPLNLSKA